MRHRRPRHRLLVLLLAAAALLAAIPAAARAATCADFTNQAAAQRAANTRDGDGDGIYCESLPCPCATGSGGTVTPQAVPRRRRPRRLAHLGRTVRLSPWTRRSGCHPANGLPDPRCTPGTRYANVTKTQVCSAGYAGRVRNVTARAKADVYGAYGIVVAFDGTDGEVDHLVSLELGGTNSRANLWPQSAAGRAGAAEKDRLENRLHDDVCSGRIGLRDAQRLIASDWLAAYHRRFG